ncbi:MAG: translation elongation factor 4 [Candidatus Makana argininalis]
MFIKTKNIRNFSIIAHIDHGKSTLSDRIIQICDGLSIREMSHRVLDSMEIEKERGITIKSQSAALYYKYKNNQIYQLNLIDTPGHIDFSYEVSRSMYACEGAILLIDATQGIEAQTLTNYNLAIEMNLKIITVINKIDLPNADIDKVIKNIKNILGVDSSNIILCSSKTGYGVNTIVKSIIKNIPFPAGDINSPLQALIIDSWFDNYLGVTSLIRIKNGKLQIGNKIKIMSTGKIYKVKKLGIFTPKKQYRNFLNCGEVGWLSCSIKNINKSPVGDTITLYSQPSFNFLPGFKKSKPMVYTSLFPTDSKNYKNFKQSLEKLSLNDASLYYENEKSNILGFGFRCGFLGLLHMEIIKERILREYHINIINTLPSVTYQIITNKKKIKYIDNPSNINNINHIYEFREPIVECNIVLPKKYLGKIISLCEFGRGVKKNIFYIGNQIKLIYDIPMYYVILDFFDKLKSNSCGYASLDYNFKKFKKSDIVKVDILINKNKIDSLSVLIHRNDSINYGRKLINKLKNIIPRHQFNISIQAVIGNNVILRSNVKQLRKNVLSKCYGGDISRKKKLLKKQKEGKKKMKYIGNINIPKNVFINILKTNK